MLTEKQAAPPSCLPTDCLLKDRLPFRNPCSPLAPWLQLSGAHTLPAEVTGWREREEQQGISYRLDLIYSSPSMPWPQLRLGFDAGGDFLLTFLIGEVFARGFLAWAAFFSLFLGSEDSTISSLEGSSRLVSL